MKTVPSSSAAVPHRTGSLGVQARSRSLLETISSSTGGSSVGSPVGSNASVWKAPVRLMPNAPADHRSPGGSASSEPATACASADNSTVELEQSPLGEVLAEREQIAPN